MSFHKQNIHEGFFRRRVPENEILSFTTTLKLKSISILKKRKLKSEITQIPGDILSYTDRSCQVDT